MRKLLYVEDNEDHGLTLQEMHIAGDASAVPQNVKAIIDKAKLRLN